MKYRIDKINAFEKLDNFEKHYLHHFSPNFLNPVLLAFEWDTNSWHYLVTMVKWGKKQTKKQTNKQKNPHNYKQASQPTSLFALEDFFFLFLC